MAVADAVLCNSSLNILREAADEFSAQVFIAFEVGKSAFLLRERNRTAVGGVTDRARRIGCDGERAVAVIRQPEHDQSVSETSDPKANAPRAASALGLWLQGKPRDVDDIVE